MACHMHAASQVIVQAFLRTKLRKMETEPVGLREALDALCGQPPQAALQECRFRRKGPLQGEAVLPCSMRTAASVD